MFLIIVFTTALTTVFAQTRVVNKLILPVKREIRFTHKDITPAAPLHNFEINTAAEPAPDPLLFFNNQPLLNLRKPLNRLRFLYTELSFADVLEGGMNSAKPGIINTYDDNITELFKDAPSLVKLTCIIQL